MFVINQFQYYKTRRFSNHKSLLLLWSHTFAIIIILDLTPYLLRLYDRIYPRIIMSKSHENTLLTKLNEWSLTPRWPLTPSLLRSHVWLYPRIIVSKSHWTTSMYVDTEINFAKYHIYTTYTRYIHTTYRMSDHIVSFWTQFRWDKNQVAEYIHIFW